MLVDDSKIMIWDTFLYSGELEILKFRLESLNQYCDQFVIVESSYTFSGMKREVTSDQIRLTLAETYPDKIRWVVLEEFQNFVSVWDRESWQRNQILCWISDANENDIVLLSDVDEIPNANFLKEVLFLSKQEIKVAKMNLCFYDIHFLSNRHWHGTIATKFQADLNFQDLRNRATNYWNLTAKEIVMDSGVHLSSIGGARELSRKIRSFSHTEFNVWPFKSHLFLKILIGLGICFDGSEVLLPSNRNEECLFQGCGKAHRMEFLRLILAKMFCPIVRIM